MLRPRPQKSPIVPDALKELQSAHMLGKLVMELRSLYKKIEQKLNEVDTKITQQKGPKGDRGIPGPKGDNTPKKGVDYFTQRDIDQVVSLVSQRVAQFPQHGEDGYTPKKGQDYFTKEDVQEIVDLVTYRIGRPRDGKDAVIDPNMVIEAVKKQLNSDDTKKGLNQTVSAFVNQVLARGGYLHGGGDTVEAGDNITITDVNGKKRISATGGSGAVDSVNGQTGVVVITYGDISMRVVSMADATSFTPTSATADINTQTNTQVAGTLTANAPSGTPTDGQRLILRIKSTNVQTFSWNAIYRGSNTVVLPVATTGSSKTDYFGFVYNSADSKWDCLSASYGYT